jgi:hypothetical protein
VGLGVGVGGGARNNGPSPNPLPQGEGETSKPQNYETINLQTSKTIPYFTPARIAALPPRR